MVKDITKRFMVRELKSTPIVEITKISQPITVEKKTTVTNTVVEKKNEQKEVEKEKIIIEETEIRILSGKVKHVDVTMPDRLIRMPVHCNYQVIWEYRIWIDQNVIFLALSSLELDHYLLRGTVLTT